MPPPRARRALVVVDQVLASVSTLAVSLLAATSLSAVNFGYFTALMALVLLIMGGVRSLVVDSEVIGTGGNADSLLSSGWVLVQRAVLWGAFGGALVGALVLIVGSTTGTEQVNSSVVPVLLASAAVSAQESMRTVAVASRRPDVAVVSDLLLALILSGGYLYGLLVAPVTDSPSGALLWWAASCLAALLPSLVLKKAAGRGHRALWRPNRVAVGSLATFALQGAPDQASRLLLAVVAGPASLAAFRLTQVVLGPTRVLLAGLRALALAGVTRGVADDLGATRRRLRWASLLILTTALGIAVVALSMPTTVMVALLGPSWILAAPFIFPAILPVVAQAWEASAALLLRSQARFNRLVAARGFAAPLVLVGPSAGFILAGLTGALVGASLGFVASAVLYQLPRGSEPR